MRLSPLYLAISLTLLAACGTRQQTRIELHPEAKGYVQPAAARHALRREDFNNDKVDAGEIGAGHDVTALYEITLVNSGGESVDPLRYAKSVATPSRQSDEIGWLRWRPTLLATTAGAIAPSS